MKKVKTVGMFATSSSLSRPKKPDDYKYLKLKGFRIKEGESLRKVTSHTAGSIEERVEDIHNFLKDDTIDILMAYWGGANTNQLLPYLDYDLFSKYPKPIIGYSDTSALLVAVNKLSKIVTYMGPAGISFDKPDPFDYTFKYLNKIIIERNSEVKIEDSDKFADDLYFLRSDSDHRILQKNPGRRVFVHGKAKGFIIASNLQTLMVLAGTKYFPNLEGKVVFLEEDEGANTQMIHRFLTHLSQVVDLNKLGGICIGRFMSKSGFSEKDSEEEIYKDVFKNIDIPIIYNLDFGHTDPLFTIPLGGKATIDTRKNLIIVSDY